VLIKSLEEKPKRRHPLVDTIDGQGVGKVLADVI
jgi:hypothetical protein